MMSLTLKSIDHIQICIPKGNEQKAKSFYFTILGFKEIEKPESLKNNGGFWCQLGDIQLHIGVEEHLL